MTPSGLSLRRLHEPPSPSPVFSDSAAPPEDASVHDPSPCIPCLPVVKGITDFHGNMEERPWPKVIGSQGRRQHGGDIAVGGGAVVRIAVGGGAAGGGGGVPTAGIQAGGDGILRGGPGSGALHRV